MSEGDRYFQEELNYLVEAGREYGALHPERARFLNLADPRARDPHVERLIEAVAFLTGNIRQRLDDDFPELTHSLLNLVWPHYLRPIPPMALVQFEPVPGMVRTPERIPRGFLVESRLTSREVPCRFVTSYDVDVHPLHLESVQLPLDQRGRPSLLLRFQVLEGADVGKIDLRRLRLCVFGEPPVAFCIYRVLRELVESLTLTFPGGTQRRFGPAALRPVGFEETDELLPYPSVSFPGYRLLSEYFAFPEKFLFFDLVNLGPLQMTEKGPRTFDLNIHFTRRPPESFRPDTDSIRLHVTPVVNIFHYDADPLRVDHLRSAYRVLADATHPDAYEVVSVEKAVGLRPGDQKRRNYSPFFSFDHELRPRSNEAFEQGAFFHVNHRVLPTGRWATYLSLVSTDEVAIPAAEVLSLEVTCMNGRLCEEVELGDIHVPSERALNFARFKNITRPTEAVLPNLGKGAEWRFISHMALNFVSLEDVRGVRALLALYNVGERPAHHRRINSLRSFTSHPVEMIVGGNPVRGTELTATIEEGDFDDEGDLLLFTAVLSRFFGMYAGVNSFTRFVTLRSPSGEVIRWPAVTGTQKLI